MSQDFLDLMSHPRLDSVRTGTSATIGRYRIVPTANHWGLWRGDVFIGEISRPGYAALIARLLNEQGETEP